MSKSFAHTLPVYHAEDISVTSGANLGDVISFADELDVDDIYEVRAGAVPTPLAVQHEAGGMLAVAPGSPLGTEGQCVHLDAALTMMTSAGTVMELLVMVEVDGHGDVDAIYVLPLSQLVPRTDYTLIGIDRAGARARFAQLACVSFSRGTRVTMASGAQRAVEDLTPGDIVLTRDDGAQTLRWIGAATVRAVGDFAPVRIRAGALNNAADLVVSPDNRLFIYQRSDALGAGRP